MVATTNCVLNRVPSEEIPDVNDDFDFDPPTVEIPAETMAQLSAHGPAVRS